MLIVFGEVVSVIVAVTGLVPEMGGGFTAEQIGVPEKSEGDAEQVSDICPVNPPDGVTVIVEVPVPPAVRVSGVPLIEKEGETGCAVKTIGTLTVVNKVPLEPVTVTV